MDDSAVASQMAAALDSAAAGQMTGAQVSAAADQVPGTPDPVVAGGPAAASNAAISDGEKASNASQCSTKPYKKCTPARRGFLASVKTSGYHAWHLPFQPSSPARPASLPLSKSDEERRMCPSSCFEMRPVQLPET